MTPDYGMDLDLEEDLQASQHRWLLSYADLMTLLFSLFVVLFSSMYLGQKKPREISTGVRQAFGDVPELAPLKDLLEDRLKLSIASGQTELHLETRGLVINLKDVALFAPGDTRINPDAHGVIEQIARAIEPLPNLIAVEGHSDGITIHNSRFHDNWELSAARSVAMLRYLNDSYGVPPARLSATAFADTRPLSDNASASGRAQNRRVDIVVLSERSR